MTPSTWPGWTLAPKPTSSSARRSRSAVRSRTGRHTTEMRLNAFLARAGVASRRKSDELIKAGRVRVNGELGELNTFVESRDVVEVDGQPVAKQRLAYVLLNKPAGVVTTASDPQRRPTVVSLVEHESRVVPVGRLDVETTGALLLTNDGPLAHTLAHPRYGVEKVYEVETWKEPNDEALRRLADGRRARGRRHVARARAAARRGPLRARPPRGQEPPGAPHVRGCRASRATTTPECLCGPAGRRARSRGVARADARRGRAAREAGPVRVVPSCGRSRRRRLRRRRRRIRGRRPGGDGRRDQNEW